VRHAVLALIISSFSLTFAQAKSLSWEEAVDVVVTGEGDVAKARQGLISDPALDEQLRGGLAKGGRSELRALNAIRLLPRPSMVKELLGTLAKLPASEKQGQLYFVTLASMAGGEHGAEILAGLQAKVNVTSKTVPSSLRLALLSGMSLRSTAPTGGVLLQLLDDTSFEIRLKAMELATNRFKGGEKEQQEFLLKAMERSPYPLRLKALSVIGDLPAAQRQRYKSEVTKCAQSDQNQVVKEACASLKF
jgi:hypothetical protein